MTLLNSPINQKRTHQISCSFLVFRSNNYAYINAVIIDYSEFFFNSCYCTCTKDYYIEFLNADSCIVASSQSVIEKITFVIVYLSRIYRANISDFDIVYMHPFGSVTAPSPVNYVLPANVSDSPS